MFRYSSDTMRSPIEGKRNDKPLKSYSCDLCKDSKWQNETDVEIHRKEVHLEKLIASMSDKENHFCKICVRQFTDAAAVLRHIKSVHFLSSPTATQVEREIFICEYCNNIFFNKKLLSVHITHAHSPKSRKSKARIECPVCSKILKLQNVWSHFLYHKIPSISTCQICLQSCENKSELQEHLKIHPFYYKCDVCGYQTRFSSTFYKHTSTHRTKDTENCSLTNFDVKDYFASRYTVAWKYDIDISGLKGLRIPKNVKICVMCREICTEQRFFKDHILKDHCIEEESKKIHRCNCGEEFFNNVLLKHHIFKLKGKHGVNENVADDIDQELVIYQVCEDQPCEEIIDDCEEIDDDEEFIVTRETVPVAYGVNKGRSALDVDYIDHSEEVIEENVNVQVNENVVESQSMVMDHRIIDVIGIDECISNNVQYIDLMDQSGDADQNVEVLIP